MTADMREAFERAQALYNAWNDIPIGMSHEVNSHEYKEIMSYLNSWERVWQAAQGNQQVGEVCLSELPENERQSNLMLKSDEQTSWPDNIAAERHEVSKKWVLHYLTDKQAAKCKAALAAIQGGGK